MAAVKAPIPKFELHDYLENGKRLIRVERVGEDGLLIQDACSDELMFLPLKELPLWKVVPRE